MSIPNVPMNQNKPMSVQLMERRMQEALQRIVRVLTPDLKDRMEAEYSGRMAVCISIQKGFASHIEVRHSVNFEPKTTATIGDVIAVLRDITHCLMDEFQTPSRCVFAESYFGDVTLVIPMWSGRCGVCYTEARQTHKVTA